MVGSRARSRLRNPEAAAEMFRKRGDRQTAVMGVDERTEIAHEIRIAQEQPAGQGRALRGGQCLPFPEPLQPQYRCARAFCCIRRGVARAVVGDDYLGLWKRAP